MEYLLLYFLILLNIKFLSSEKLANGINSSSLNADNNLCKTTWNRKLSSLCIDETLQHLRQDNSKLIETLRNNYIYPPSQLDYNLTYVTTPYSSVDDKLLSGQYEEASNIEKKLLEVLLL